MKYRKKPVVIDAIQWVDGENDEEIGAFLGLDYAGHRTTWYCGCPTTLLRVNTLEGAISARSGDYIIRGVQGEHYPCKPDIFEATYDLVSSD